MKSNSNLSLWTVLFCMLLVMSATSLMAGGSCVRNNTGQCELCPTGMTKSDIKETKAELATVKLSSDQIATCASGHQCTPKPDCDPSACVFSASSTSNSTTINKVKDCLANEKHDGTIHMINSKQCGSSASCDPGNCKPGPNCKSGKDCSRNTCKKSS